MALSLGEPDVSMANATARRASSIPVQGPVEDRSRSTRSRWSAQRRRPCRERRRRRGACRGGVPRRTQLFQEWRTRDPRPRCAPRARAVRARRAMRSSGRSSECEMSGTGRHAPSYVVPSKYAAPCHRSAAHAVTAPSNLREPCSAIRCSTGSVSVVAGTKRPGDVCRYLAPLTAPGVGPAFPIGSVPIGHTTDGRTQRVLANGSIRPRCRLVSSATSDVHSAVDFRRIWPAVDDFRPARRRGSPGRICRHRLASSKIAPDYPATSDGQLSDIGMRTSRSAATSTARS